MPYHLLLRIEYLSTPKQRLQAGLSTQKIAVLPPPTKFPLLGMGYAKGILEAE